MEPEPTKVSIVEESLFAVRKRERGMMKAIKNVRNSDCVTKKLGSDIAFEHCSYGKDPNADRCVCVL
jgi:hypothetical protein